MDNFFGICLGSMMDSSKLESIIQKANAWLSKELLTLIHRIERILVPMNSMTHDPVLDRIEILVREVKSQKYLIDSPERFVGIIMSASASGKDKYDSKNIECICRQIDWDAFRSQLFRLIRNGDESAPIHPEIMLEIESLKEGHRERFQKALRKECLRQMQVRPCRSCYSIP